MSDWYTTTSEFRSLMAWQRKHEKEYFMDKVIVTLEPAKQTKNEMYDKLLSALREHGHERVVCSPVVDSGADRAAVKFVTDAVMQSYWAERSGK